MGRSLAICGWLAWQTRRLFRGGARRERAGSVIALALAGLLLTLAALPIVLPQLDAQPEDVTVQQIFDGTTTHPDGWVRLRGRLTPLTEPVTDKPGSYALLIDAVNPLRAVVVRGAEQLDAAASAAPTGILTSLVVLVEEDLPIEATVAGTPPRIVVDRIVALDPSPKPVRSVLWPISIPPALLAVMLLIGTRTGYPVFQPTSEVDVLAGPLAPGERVPSAYGGRIGANERALTDPGGALLLVRRGPRGSLLTAQPLADEDGRPAPAPVTIGGSWTSGRIGSVHTVRETVPALQVRSEQVDATFLFARTAERDRVAALVAVSR
jgi:hypothetical protein